MANLNRIILIGKLAAEPEGRATVDGLAITRLKLLVNRNSGPMSSQVPIEGSDLIDVVAWRELAEYCSNSLKKGQLVLVDGRIQVRSFDNNVGERRWATEVVARNVQALENVSATASPEATPTGDMVVEASDLASDLPF